MRCCRLPVALVILLSLLCSSLAAQDQSLTWKSMVREIKLKNGMRFLLVSRPQSPSISAGIIYPVGWLDEQPQEAGLSQIFYQLDLSPEAIPENNFPGILHRNGANKLRRINRPDFSGHIVDLPSHKLELWAYLESLRIQNVHWDSAIQKLRQLREQEQWEIEYSHPFLRFPGTILASPPIKAFSDREALSTQQIRSFYQEHFHPRKAVGFLVGDFQIDRARKLLDRHLGRISIYSQAPAHKATPKQTWIPEKLLQISSSPHAPRTHLSFALPILDPERYTAIRILQEVLENRLRKKMIRERHLASSIHVHLLSVPRYSRHILLIDIKGLASHSPKELLFASRSIVNALKKRTPGKAIMDQMRQQLILENFNARRSNQQIVRTLEAAEIHFYKQGGWQQLDKHLTRLITISPEYIQSTANKLFSKPIQTVALPTRQGIL